MDVPTIGRIVIYRFTAGKTGAFDVPAVVTANADSVQEARDAGVDDRSIRSLTSPEHLHLTLLTPLTVHEHGTKYVFNVGPGEEKEPGTWRWPERPEITATIVQAEADPRAIVQEVERGMAVRVARA